MRNQVRQWAGQPFMAHLVDSLLDNGFHVYLTSDHGNIEAPDVVVPLKGRLRIARRTGSYLFRFFTAWSNQKTIPGCFGMANVGLPEDYLPLLAPGRLAFTHTSKRLVGHGGATLEELVVPFVQIERRDR